MQESAHFVDVFLLYPKQLIPDVFYIVGYVCEKIGRASCRERVCIFV